MSGRPPTQVKLSENQRKRLQRLAAGDEKLARRARIVLGCADSLPIVKIAEAEETTPISVRRWRARFLAEGMAGLDERQRPGRRKSELILTDGERAELERLVRRGKVSQRLAMRARIVLLCAAGHTNLRVADDLNVNPSTVAKWRQRFAEHRFDGLCDLERPGTPRKVTDEDVEKLVVSTLEEMPKGATHWSTRSMAARTGISSSSVGRIWRAVGLKPHRTETFQLSTDPYFIEKVRDVVGLYMDPPAKAIVLSVDEKSQIQALNRTQPLLPLRPGQVERRTPEYQRNGTTTLFAALDVATGHVIGKCFDRHRATEFRRFLDEIRQNVAADLDVHMIVDNYATHKAPTVQRWLAKNPRFHLHFIPTHSSWLNEVEGWFSILTTRQLKRGSHNSVRELQKAIKEFLDAWNEDPKPFKWTKTADQILANIGRSCYETLRTHKP